VASRPTTACHQNLQLIRSIPIRPRCRSHPRSPFRIRSSALYINHYPNPSPRLAPTPPFRSSITNSEPRRQGLTQRELRGKSNGGSRKDAKTQRGQGRDSNQGSRKGAKTQRRQGWANRSHAKTQREKAILGEGVVVGVFFAPWRLERSGREIRFVAHYRTPILNLPLPPPGWWLTVCPLADSLGPLKNSLRDSKPAAWNSLPPGRQTFTISHRNQAA
jgi:hypothetical protein